MKLTREEKIARLNKKAAPVNPDAKWMQIAKWNEEHADALDDYVIIALRISSTLKAKKMTQKELATQLGVTPQALTRIMKGRQNLTLNKVRQIEKILDISIMKIDKVEQSQVKVRTKVKPTKVNYNYSTQPFWEKDINISKFSGRKEKKESIENLSIAA